MVLPRQSAGRPLLILAITLAVSISTAGIPPAITIDTPMAAPEWARLERALLEAHVPACREFFRKYYDDRGYFRCFLRWGANDGPDDAFENFAGWPDLHALGAEDEILHIFLKSWNGMIRNRIPRAIVGFNNALLVTGDMKYVDAWRSMTDAINANARVAGGRREYPTMYGPDGWYGWQAAPWRIGALEVWYWSQRPEDRARIGANSWVEFLEGKNPGFPEEALRRDLESLAGKVESFRRDARAAEKRLADNVMDWNPASVVALEQLMWGALPPGRAGELLNARLRYFDPATKRAGVPEDVAALVTEMSDTRTTVTLVNLHPAVTRSIIVQGGAYGEQQIVEAMWNGRKKAINARDFAVRLAPGAGARLTLTVRRYVNAPTVRFPWNR